METIRPPNKPPASAMNRTGAFMWRLILARGDSERSTPRWSRYGCRNSERRSSNGGAVDGQLNSVGPSSTTCSKWQSRTSWLLVIPLQRFQEGPSRADPAAREIVTLSQLHALGCGHADVDRPRLHISTGARGGPRREPAALRVKDFDGKVVTIRESVKGSRGGDLGSTKTDKMRRVPVPNWLGEMIAELAKGKLPEAWLLPSPSGLMMNPSNWRRRVFEPIARKTLHGVDLKPHDLRHSAASIWAELKYPDGYRSLMLGHSSSQGGVSPMTAHYTHLTAGMEAAVVKALERGEPPDTSG